MTTRRTRARRILFTHYGDEWIRGSERCLLDLMTHLDRDRFEPVLWCNNQCLAHAARELGIEVLRTEFSVLLGWQTPRFDVKNFYRLYRTGSLLVRLFRIDLIHSNSAMPCQWLNLVARRHRIPLVTHLHSPYPLRDRITLGLHHVAMAVGVSEAVIRQLRSDGMDADRTTVIHNGIDTERLRAQPTLELRGLLGYADDDLVIATIGSLVHRKGVDLLIEAVTKARLHGVPAKLVVIGDGPCMGFLREQIASQGMQQHVHLLGECDDAFGLLCSGVDIYASAAREEAFGLVFAEAGLASLPVIAPRSCGIPEVVHDEVTGRLFRPEDTDDACRQIIDLYKHPSLRESLGAAGHEHVTRCFDIRNNVSRFEALYTRLLTDDAHHLRWHSHWQPVASMIGAVQSTLSMLTCRFGGGSKTS